MPHLYSISFYVPLSSAEAVKEAMFAAGAGRIGHYDRCCWQTRGQGQFRPLAGANPALGEVGQLETVEEWKVEMVCEAAALEPAIAALRRAHPYETPAYLVVRTESL